MKRIDLIAGIAAAAGLAATPAARAATPSSPVTIDGLLGEMPPPASGRWVQYVMGSGVVYSKKIGLGREHTSSGTLPFIETQIGDAEATCNPNTIKKAYIRSPRYGDLLAPHAVTTYVVKAGTAFSILNTDASDELYLLDADDLYTRSSGRVTGGGADTVTMHRRVLATRRVELAFVPAAANSMRTMTLWLSPHVPFGVARMHVTRAGSEPFDLRVDAFGDAYFSLVPDSLDALRKSGA